MKINEVIRKYRRQRGLTQEQVAQQLGVSTPAVNKWESGSCYPDITLLPALARLLRVDLNTLLCFQEHLSDQQIGAFANEVYCCTEQQGFTAGFEMAMERMREYPNSDRLACMLASVLEGGLIFFHVEEKENYQQQIDALYQRLLDSEDTAVHNTTRRMLVSRYIAQQNYQQAQQLLDEIENERPLDKIYFQAQLDIAQENYPKAKQALEQKLFSQITEVQSILLSLIDIALKEADTQQAERLADIASAGADVFELMHYGKYSTYLQIVMAEKDKERVFALLTKMLSALQERWEPEKTTLYRDIPQKEQDPRLGNMLAKSILQEIKNSGEDGRFVWEDARFEQLYRQYVEE